MSGEGGEDGGKGPKVARSRAAESCEVVAGDAEGAYFDEGVFEALGPVLVRRRLASRSQRAGSLLLVRELRRGGLVLAVEGGRDWQTFAPYRVASAELAAGVWLDLWNFPDQGTAAIGPRCGWFDLVRWWGDLRLVEVREKLARRILAAVELARKSPDGWSHPGLVGFGGLVLG